MKKEIQKNSNQIIVSSVEHTIKWMDDLIKYSDSISDDLKFGLDLHKSQLEIALGLHKIANKEVA